MKRAVIVEALRTPIGKANGTLKKVAPEQLASKVMSALLEKTQVSAEVIDDVILGNVVGPGGNMGRLSSLTAGFPNHVPGVAIDRQCGSGLEAVVYGMRLVQAGAGDMYVAGGVESVSHAPWKMERPSSIHQIHPPRFYMRAPFAPRHIGDPDMGVAAENVAQSYGISRDEQDIYAIRSHEKACRSQENHRFAEEIVPIHVGNQSIFDDECPRRGKLERLFKRLPPLFAEQGTVTAGNSCPMNDGAAAMLIMSQHQAHKLNLSPLVELVDAVTVGVDPNLPGIGPVPAVQSLLKRNGLGVDDLDLVELNEAFASQVLASIKKLEIPEEKVNIGGGAIALGHPYGASGSIIVTRLVHELVKKKGNLGIATMGIGGGMGMAVLVKRPSAT